MSNALKNNYWYMTIIQKLNFKTTQGIKDRYIEFDQLNYLKGITEND